MPTNVTTEPLTGNNVNDRDRLPDNPGQVRSKVSDVVDQAKSSVSDTYEQTKGKVSDAVDQAKSKVNDAVNQTKSKLNDYTSNASDKLNQNRVAAASGMDSVANTIHERAHTLPGGEKVAVVAHAAADKLTETADYVRQNDFAAMRNDLEGVVKKNPGPSLLFVAVLGFLIGRAVSSSSRS